MAAGGARPRIVAVSIALAACGPAPAPTQPTQGTPSAPPPARAADARAADAPAADAPPILAAHNRHRADHCAGPLAWSDALAAESQRWADELAARDCAFAHNPNTKHGENLAFFGPPGSMTGEGVAQMWYAEVALYDFARPGFSFEAGHFTQLVWRGTERLGCASTECGGGELWVCNYAPAGNVETLFERNVLPTSCR